MSNFFDSMQAERLCLSRIARELGFLTDAFEETGNDRLADKLRRMSANLYASEERIGKAVSDNINAGFRQSVENSTNILRAAMAGIEVGSKGD